MKTMSATLSLLYGLVIYAAFWGAFLYTVGFVGDVGVPKTIDSGQPGPLAEALLVDGLLLGLFAVQHSVMARRSFKRWWTRFVPPAVERSTYVLAATAALALLLWQWRPLARPTIWRVENPAGVGLLQAVFWLAWTGLLLSTFLIDHFELFGLRQVFARLRGQEVRGPRFVTPLFYRWVRHPIYLGFLLAFWAAPVMSAGHLLFSLASSGYILVGVAFEERDLIAQYGDRYRSYREQVGMLLPRRSRASARKAPVEEG
jgi:protein-S-isoprenylcysteine O-methyltransferase Ste14